MTNPAPGHDADELGDYDKSRPRLDDIEPAHHGEPGPGLDDVELEHRDECDRRSGERNGHRQRHSGPPSRHGVARPREEAGSLLPRWLSVCPGRRHGGQPRHQPLPGDGTGSRRDERPIVAGRESEESRLNGSARMPSSGSRAGATLEPGDSVKAKRIGFEQAEEG